MERYTLMLPMKNLNWPPSWSTRPTCAMDATWPRNWLDQRPIDHSLQSEVPRGENAAVHPSSRWVWRFGPLILYLPQHSILNISLLSCHVMPLSLVAYKEIQGNIFSAVSEIHARNLSYLENGLRVRQVTSFIPYSQNCGLECTSNNWIQKRKHYIIYWLIRKIKVFK